MRIFAAVLSISTRSGAIHRDHRFRSSRKQHELRDHERSAYPPAIIQFPMPDRSAYYSARTLGSASLDASESSLSVHKLTSQLIIITWQR